MLDDTKTVPSRVTTQLGFPFCVDVDERWGFGLGPICHRRRDLEAELQPWWRLVRGWGWSP